MNSAATNGSIWRQPARVWAVAFASVVAFMGIGLADPILPAIAESLKASPTETELLFTSYLLVTGLAMLQRCRDRAVRGGTRPRHRHRSAAAHSWREA